jgi:rare lipoprotein A
MNHLRNRRRGRWPLGLGLSFFLLVQGCAVVGGASAPAPAPEDLATGWTETGVASWYGHPFHGRITASGEVYDMNDPTCAHQFLPFGTRLRVENLDNGRSTTLTVNDRGPFVDRRILDVSRWGAQELEMIGPGTARVRITILEVGGR